MGEAASPAVGGWPLAVGEGAGAMGSGAGRRAPGAGDGRVRGFRDLRVWRASMDFVEAIYSVTRLFPPEERFGLTAQLRKSAISVPSNIAEGYGSGHRGVYHRHIAIACGSLAEAQTQIEIAVRLGYIEIVDATPLADQSGSIGRMLYRLRRRLADR